MPTISEMSYGYDGTGVATYLDQIKTEALQKAKDAILNTSNIETVCDNEWEGKAREQFKQNLKADAQHVADQYDALYNVLQSEINSVLAAMKNKDETLISE